jgi:hypothetical protein
MDKNMVIQHVQFGEVAAYLQADQEVQTDKDKEDKEGNERRMGDDTSQNKDHHATQHALDTDIIMKDKTDSSCNSSISSSSSSSSSSSNNSNSSSSSSSSSSSNNNSNSSSSSSSEDDMQRPRAFLAQYAISEIPTLIGDVSPFPEIIKTGKDYTELYCTVPYCRVLSCLVLPCLVLSCLVLSCLVLSCLVLS